MEHINKDVSLEELNMLSKVDNFIFLQKDVNDQIFSNIKYIVIRKIPLIFLIMLIITLFLIYYTSVNKYNNDNNIAMTDKFCYLFMGLTIVIANVYLLSLRTEYKHKMNTMYKYKKEIDDYNTIKINEALYAQKNNI